ncbi:calcium-binding tyrosine phosphorylation-regulated protein isoform X1 [Elephas maximus indicus]|uniref:calcium-binding tyrosine phosphorylation-regulated protein isoform X1 n=1 Tax=Elephas maximus indicus TaxID=99487 RepID=UPI000C8113E1|nr:calcium-binding tyrosine phosphorylation-regulated protein isoform X1 [Loxodonta africana]XP_023399695.1 calcium-binding tyrosine phosphorylation-regulated protein isoform X1 [Loxodonta africana]XP_023399696.1 calcium-binding tyrosine phosphorylation-regulated protein isoform X1 [Loxodonta africana]XP_023399697.1 calcium-binding tyrosine phosphorylation-regulated protein isoform X1 [Loxodonta africana]XP_049757623.1 calcium-binding tyrosine phosphorylation-regulated protein isoform X1 [Eleph
MISSKPRLVVPYGLKTLLEGVSRAVLKTNPANITQFAAIYFKELILFREGNTSMDIKELVKQFHQIKVEKWSEGTIQEKKPECVKEPERASVIPPEPTRKEKSTDTEEDNIAKPLFSNKTTQFPSVHAELSEHVDVPEIVSGSSSKPSTPKVTTPPSSPSPAAVPPEFAYVPADPAQFAAQMLGKISSVHSDQSDVLMVDVATSMPALPEEVLSSEAVEDTVVSPLVCSGEVVAMQVLSQTSVHVDLGPKPKDDKAEPSTASPLPLQDEQEPPAYDQAPEVAFQADIEVTSTLHISSIYNDVPVTEGVFVEQMPEQIVIPFTDQVACLKENEQSPPVSPKPVATKTASGMSAKSVNSAKLVVQLEDEEKRASSVHLEAEGTVLLSDTSLKGLQEVAAQPLHAEGSVQSVGSEKSLHLEVEFSAVVPDDPGQDESWGHSAPLEMEVKPVFSGGSAKDVRSSTSVESSSGSPNPVPEGLKEPEIEPEGEAAPE